MKKAYHIIKGWACVACLFLMAACVQTDDGLPGGLSEGGSSEGDASGGAVCYLSVRLAIGDGALLTRSNPTGGEEGDGRVAGTTEETAVRGITLFLLDETADWNTADGRAARILAAYYFGAEEVRLKVPGADGAAASVDVVYETKTKNIPDWDVDRCKALAVTNVDYTGKVANGTWSTLGDLRDETAGDEWLWQGVDPENIMKTNFLMSSTELVTVSGIRQSTEESPATATLSVERLAARVDYRTDKEVFPVTDREGNTVGQVTVRGAVVVNQLTGKTNLFKHVAEEYPDRVDAASIGRETEDEAGKATNWVVDAYSGEEKQSSHFTHFLPDLSKKEPGWESSFSEGFAMTVEGKPWHCLGYVRENTNVIQDADELWRKATGVVFKAQYDVTGDGRFKPGQDLYRYKGVLYPDLEALEGVVQGVPEGVTLTPENCAEYGVAYYKGGICYYTYFIRHAHDGNDDAFGTMEYAIVRNNLYQLLVKSASGIGDPEPGESELVIEVAVKKWGKMEEENVELQ